MHSKELDKYVKFVRNFVEDIIYFLQVFNKLKTNCKYEVKNYEKWINKINKSTKKLFDYAKYKVLTKDDKFMIYLNQSQLMNHKLSIRNKTFKLKIYKTENDVIKFKIIE